MGMDEIIQKIIETDRRARKIIDESRKESESHDSDMVKEIEDYKYNAYKDIWGKIDQYSAEQSDEVSEKVGQIEKAAAEQIAGMKDKADVYEEEWVEHLFKKILAGEIG